MHDWWEHPAAAPAKAATHRASPRAMPENATVPDEATWLAKSCTIFDTEVFGTFVEEWMSMPYRERKMLSYSGAVLSRPDAPTHYHCPQTARGCFDPGNWIYSLVLDMMCPSLMPKVTWNLSTEGDICEAIMGCG